MLTLLHMKYVISIKRVDDFMATVVKSKASRAWNVKQFFFLEFKLIHSN